MRILVLASSSSARKRLLARFGLAFEVDPADLDESPRAAEEPRAMVARLAAHKAATVAQRHPDAIIVASDQVGVLDGRLLNKPGDTEAAFLQLRAASGREVQFLTALCVLDTRTGRRLAAVEPCTVRFRNLSDAVIRDYVAREQPLDCAGSFRVEGLGIALFQSLDLQDPTALEGLPLIRLSEHLAELGMPVLRG